MADKSDDLEWIEQHSLPLVDAVGTEGYERLKALAAHKAEIARKDALLDEIESQCSTEVRGFIRDARTALKEAEQ